MRSDAGTSRPLVVELLGLPGAGKTTVAAQLIGLLAERDLRADTITTAGRAYAARTRLGRVVSGRTRDRSARAARVGRALEWQLFVAIGAVHSVRFALERPSFTRHVIERQMRRDLPLARRAQIVRGFLRLCGRHRCLTASPQAATAVVGASSDVLVLDDGFVHRAVELHASGFEPPCLASVQRYLAAVPEPDLLVLVDAGLATCERRVRTRGLWSHSRELTAAQLSTYLAGCRAVVEVATSCALEREWPTVRVENERDGLDHLGLDHLRRAVDEVVSAGTLTRIGPLAATEVVA